MNYRHEVSQHNLAVISTEELARRERGRATVHGQLNLERIAFLRAVASGIPTTEATARYFPDLPQREQRQEAQATISIARALARRHGDSAAHLIGLDIWAITKTKGQQRGLESEYNREAFIAYLEDANPHLAVSLELSDEAEIRETYREYFPQSDAPGGSMSELDGRRETRKARLVALYVDAVRRLEKVTVETPKPQDAIEDWLPLEWIPVLHQSDLRTLDDLGRKIRVGGRWYSEIDGLRPGIAAKVVRYLERLLPGRYVQAEAVDVSEVQVLTGAYPISSTAAQVQLAPSPHPHPLLATTLKYTRPADCAISAKNDHDAIDEWIQSTCNSETTARSYLREGRRFAAWLAAERNGKCFGEATNTDCLAYLTFLQNIPERYISRRRLSKDEAGGLIFRGPLSDESIAQARTIVGGMYHWLKQVAYVPRNPWKTINKKISRRVSSPKRSSKAFDDGWLSNVLNYLAAQPPGVAKSRMVFVFEFGIRTGLRPSEFVQATIGDLERTDDGLFLHVIGKGNKERWCVVNGGAEGALRQYLRERSLPPIESCEPSTPLVANLGNAEKTVSYQALHESFKIWCKKLDKALQGEAVKGSPTLHRLRHTFATKAVKDGVPYDVIQGQLGHANVNTTISVYATAPDRRRAQELKDL